MSKENVNNGVWLPTIVFIVFLVLKLAGIGMVAAWSWWWVTSPLWLYFGVVALFLAVWLIGFIIWSIIKELKK